MLTGRKVFIKYTKILNTIKYRYVSSVEYKNLKLFINILDDLLGIKVSFISLYFKILQIHVNKLFCIISHITY